MRYEPTIRRNGGSLGRPPGSCGAVFAFRPSVLPHSSGWGALRVFRGFALAEHEIDGASGVLGSRPVALP